MEVVIEPFREEFQEEARALIEAYLEERWGALDPTLNSDIRDITSAYREGLFVVALLEGRVVGTGAILPETQDTARIVRMTVKKGLRKRGIGAKIVAFLAKNARFRGKKRLVLETTETWESAIAFYTRYGFRVLGRWDGDCHFELDLLPEQQNP